MPRILDNIKDHLRTALRKTLSVSEHADFCVGYFNLRGWKHLSEYVDKWSGGPNNECRLLVGMQRLPEEELREAFALGDDGRKIDNSAALRLKTELAEEFRRQLIVGAPTNDDEQALKALASQLVDKKLRVKLYLKHTLHAKLYLLYRPQDFNNPITGYVGSSNLTMAGLASQGELNVDVLDQDAAQKLAEWFEDRWTDRWCIDITDDLIKVLEESWARDDLISPYEIYINMAYHLAREARTGLTEFRIPSEFGDRLFEYQTAAVKLAAHHLNKRGGVMIGDVVGLGKTLMATAVAKILESDQFTETLVICPKNLVSMWQDYFHNYRVVGRVISITTATRDLPNLPRFRTVIIDESHNLRNPEGKRYRAIQEYIDRNESKVILLSATPYNKTYVDLSSQLQLFLPMDEDIGIRPERYIKSIGETEFIRKHQAKPRTLAAFEFSEHADDWRDLMRLYLVRRTRSFIKQHYAEHDEGTNRSYLTLENGERSYFPDRVPRTVKFEVDETDPGDQYAQLFKLAVRRSIDRLKLPRYGLGLAEYIEDNPPVPASPGEQRQLDNLGRAGQRLQGFCRVNLFKRLESGGEAFLLSVSRHVLRNHVFLYAIDNGLPLPIGTQDSDVLDTGSVDPGSNDEDSDSTTNLLDDGDLPSEDLPNNEVFSQEQLAKQAEEIYRRYETSMKTRFQWIRSDLFTASLRNDLLADAESLAQILSDAGDWDPMLDTKLSALYQLIASTHPDRKIIIFSQFADTVRYLARELKLMGVSRLAGVTGSTDDPTAMARRFSPVSNERPELKGTADELRVLVATDVLSEGQNLQDAAIVVNYDLPWAIIRLIQRAGRVDRIGQEASEILCYSFLPTEGVEQIIRLRRRVRDRLTENAEVVGTDEAFFEDDHGGQVLVDLYNEKSGILDGNEDGTEVDLASHAFQIWKNAIDADSSLEKRVQALPAVVFSARCHKSTERAPAGVLAYLKTAQDNDALVWLDEGGKTVTESQFDILRAAECDPNTPAVNRSDNHHHLVKSSMELVSDLERTIGGQLGRPSGARFRTYERLKRYAESVKGQVFATPELDRTIEDIYRSPLRPTAIDALNRQLRTGIDDQQLAELVVALREEGRLTQPQDTVERREPRIVCSLGLVQADG